MISTGQVIAAEVGLQRGQAVHQRQQRHERRRLVGALDGVGVGDVGADAGDAVLALGHHAPHHVEDLVGLRLGGGLMQTMPAISGWRVASQIVSEPPIDRPATTTCSHRAARRW